MGNTNATALGLFISISLIMLVVSVFAGFAQIVPTSAPGELPEVETDQPSIVSIFDTIWSGVLFFFFMFAFAVPGIPDAFSYVWYFLAICGLGALLVFIRSG